VKPFVDILGASGAAYRFQLVANDRQLPAMGGNLIVMKGDSAGDQIWYCGSSRGLQAAKHFWSTLAGQEPPVSIYVRRNISSAERTAELEDITKKHTSAVVVTDLDGE
jgi:hypothetical protein